MMPGDEGGRDPIVTIEEQGIGVPDAVPAEPPVETGVVGPRPTTQWQLFRRRFFRHKLAVASLVVLLLLFVVCVLFPGFFAPYPLNPEDLTSVESLEAARQPPSTEHWLGTDTLGRDELTRIIYAGRISLLLGLVVAVVSTVIGTVIGALAGYFGGWADQGLSRITDLFLIIPDLAVLAFAGKYVGHGTLLSIMLILSVLYWTYVARVVRGQVLSLREREFVEAARASGASSPRVILRHVLPNCVGPIAVAATLTVATAIITESTLSFLGFGIQPPTVSWGNLLSNAEGYAGTSLAYLIYSPGVAILLTVLAVNFLGDGLRDAFDPHLEKH